MIITELMKYNAGSKGGFPLENYSSIVPSFERSNYVPKNLFQICFRNSNQLQDNIVQTLPVAFQEHIGKLRELNAGWEYRRFNESMAKDFIIANFGEKVFSYYERINPLYSAARADFLRYLLLYCYGGAYIDLKCGLSHSLDESITSERFPVFFWDNKPNGNHHPAIPDWIPEGEILQGFIVAPKGHPFLREVIIEVMKRIDNYNPFIDGVGYGGVMKITGPGMYTETIYNCYKKYPEECYVAKPFAEFGFILHAVRNMSTEGGGYQKQLRFTDYRKLTRPLVSCGNKFLDGCNWFYLSILAKLRKLKNR